MPTLRTIRRIYSVFFMALFVWLLYVSDVERLQGYRVSLFLEADPLTALAGFLTSTTLYQGLAWAGVILIPTLFFGRFFCSWLCPLGILNQWISHLFHGRRPAESIQANAYRPFFRVKYYLLAGLLALSLLGTLQTGLLDPIALVSRSFTLAVFPALHQLGWPPYPHPPVFQGGVLVAVLFLAILLANRLMPRYWCRVICPLGGLLGVLAMGAPHRIRRDVDRCNDCQKCLQACQGGCDPHAALRVSECHLCMNCIEQCPEKALDFGLPLARTSVRQPLDFNRRRLVESALVGVALFPMARSALSSRSVALPAVVRPPGSLPEREFLARCIKCAACMRVCPTNVLQPALLEAGIEGLWTPVLIPRLGYCEHHCVLCGHACPTGAIRALAVAEKVGHPPYKEPLRLGTAFFDRGRCLPWAMQTPCIVCEEVCPTSPKAIWVRKVEEVGRDGKGVVLKQPYVEPSLCIGCGICENKCPVTDRAAIRVTSVGESRSRHNRMIL